MELCIEKETNKLRSFYWDGEKVHVSFAYKSPLAKSDGTVDRGRIMDIENHCGTSISLDWYEKHLKLEEMSNEEFEGSYISLDEPIFSSLDGHSKGKYLYESLGRTSLIIGTRAGIGVKCLTQNLHTRTFPLGGKVISDPPVRTGKIYTHRGTGELSHIYNSFGQRELQVGERLYKRLGNGGRDTVGEYRGSLDRWIFMSTWIAPLHDISSIEHTMSVKRCLSCGTRSDLICRSVSAFGRVFHICGNCLPKFMPKEKVGTGPMSCICGKDTSGSFQNIIYVSGRKRFLCGKCKKFVRTKLSKLRKEVKS